MYKTASVGLTRGPGRQTALFICFHPTGVRLVLCISRSTIDAAIGEEMGIEVFLVFARPPPGALCCFAVSAPTVDIVWRTFAVITAE